MVLSVQGRLHCSAKLASELRRNGIPSIEFWNLNDRLVYWVLFPALLFYKTSTIESILRTYPQRRFVLVGDSGEKDPEVYAELARRFPEQVMHVFIRDVSIAPALRGLRGIPVEPRGQ